MSEESIRRTAKYAKAEKLDIALKVGDMLELPYSDASFDCILCRNVISHTDTAGMRQIVEELKRVLRSEGECYLTLGSKETWGFKQDWPVVDENTKIRIEDGPENGIPHFYADYDLIQELFKDFKIELVYQLEDFYEKNGKTLNSWHYHLLIKK